MFEVRCWCVDVTACLSRLGRFATELACRKAHIRVDDIGMASVASSSEHVKERDEWDGLGEAMRMAGWFD